MRVRAGTIATETNASKHIARPIYHIPPRDKRKLNSIPAKGESEKDKLQARPALRVAMFQSSLFSAGGQCWGVEWIAAQELSIARTRDLRAAMRDDRWRETLRPALGDWGGQRDCGGHTRENIDWGAVRGLAL